MSSPGEKPLRVPNNRPSEETNLTILLYSLSLIPMLLMAMFVHELGHLAIAKLSRTKVVGFQIGIGWNIITRYSGRTSIRITPETKILQPDGENLKPGNIISVYVDPGIGRGKLHHRRDPPPMGKTSALTSRGSGNHQEAREIPHEADRTNQADRAGTPGTRRHGLGD